MANVNNPNGFLPYLAGGGGPPRITYLPLATANTAIGVGDPVTLVATGVDRAAASAALCGIAAEPKAASAGGKIAVWADPSQEFVAQTDDGTGACTTAVFMRTNANFVAGNAANGHSIAEIDEDTATTTATLPFKVLRLSDEAGNAFGEFNRLVVKINNHQLGEGTGTLAIAT